MNDRLRRVSRPLIGLEELETRVLLSAATTVTLFDTATQVRVGDAISLTALVVASDGRAVEGQAVTLIDNSHVVVGASAISGGIATFNWKPTHGGLHVLQAEFAGQGDLQGSDSGAVDINVYRLAARLTLETRAVAGGAMVTVHAAGADSMGPAVTGWVTLYDGEKMLGPVAMNRATRLALGAGSHDLSARFAGNGAYFPASAEGAVAVVARVKVVAGPVSGAVAEPAVTKAAAAPATPVGTAGVVFNSAPDASARTLVMSGDFVGESGESLLSGGPAGALMPEGEDQFGLQLPEFRQFYEFSLPPALAAPGSPAGGGSGGTAAGGGSTSLVPGAEGGNEAGKVSRPAPRVGADGGGADRGADLRKGLAQTASE